MPSASLCVAVDNAGNVLTSTNPTGGSGAWTLAAVDPGTDTGHVDSGLTGVSCPSTSLCVAVDVVGNLFTSTNPTGGVAAWTEAAHVSADYFKGVSCATASMCVAVTFSGGIATSTNPTGGAAAWSRFTGSDKTIFAVSCPSVALCVAVDQNNDVLTSTNPTGGASAWTATASVDPGNALFHVSCASTSFCALADGFGNLVTSIDPSGGAQTWKVIPPPQIPNPVTREAEDIGISGIYCPSASLCVGVGSAYNDGYVLVAGPGISGGLGISKGAGTPHACVVPRLVGRTLGAAKHALTAAGCRLGKLKRVRSARAKRNHVLSQSLLAGKRVRAGGRVNLSVGR